jgi:hypothetical protein
MLRLMIAAAFAVGLAVAMAPDADAQSKTKSTLRECRAKGTDGKLVKWKCKSEQPCCFNASINKGVCGSPVIGCF